MGRADCKSVEIGIGNRKNLVLSMMERVLVKKTGIWCHLWEEIEIYRNGNTQKLLSDLS